MSNNIVSGTPTERSAALRVVELINSAVTMPRKRKRMEQYLEAQDLLNKILLHLCAEGEK